LGAEFFLDVPELDYDFEVAEAGTALSAMVNMLKSTIRKTVVSEFQNAMVMPNRILVQLKVSEALEQTIDWGAVTHPNPEGVLRVRIVSARDLVGSDLAVFTQPTSDPYFTLTIGSQTSKTSVISRTCNPDWPEEEHFDFLCFHEDQQLVLDCFDEDMFSADDLLGRVRGVTIRQMQDRARTLDGFKYAVWLNLDVSEVEGAEDLQGKSRVLLELQFFVLSHEIPGRQQADLEAKALAGELQTTELTQSLLGRFPSQGSDMDDASPTSQAPKPVTSVNATLCNFLGAGGCGMTPTARDFPFGGARAPALPGGCNTAWLSVVLHGARGLPVDMMNKMRVKVIVSGGLRGEAPEEKLSKKAKIKQPRIQWKQQVPLTVQQVIGKMIFEEVGQKGAKVLRVANTMGNAQTGVLGPCCQDRSSGGEDFVQTSQLGVDGHYLYSNPSPHAVDMSFLSQGDETEEDLWQAGYANSNRLANMATTDSLKSEAVDAYEVKMLGSTRTMSMGGVVGVN